MRSKSATRTASGFTLIEVLVVVVVVSILMSVVVASFTGTSREQELQGYVERLALRLEMARDKALQRNREWGVYFDEEGIRFAEFDEINGTWVEYTQRPFVGDRYAEGVDFKLTVEDFTPLTNSASDGIGGGIGRDNDFGGGSGNRNNDDELPDIVLYSSGETTPFTVEVTPKDWTTRTWQLTTDGFTRIALARDE